MYNFTVAMRNNTTSNDGFRVVEPAVFESTSFVSTFVIFSSGLCDGRSVETRKNVNIIANMSGV